jgi:hypothetical protein
MLGLVKEKPEHIIAEYVSREKHIYIREGKVLRYMLIQNFKNVPCAADSVTMYDSRAEVFKDFHKAIEC